MVYIAFQSWLSFLSSWKMLVSRNRKFGWHKFWKKAFLAPWSSSHLAPFYVRLLLCLTKLFGCRSVKFMCENGCPVQWSLNVVNKEYMMFIKLNTASTSILNKALNQFADHFSNQAHKREKKWDKTKGGNRDWTGDLSICSRMLYHWAMPPCIQ